MAKDTRRFAGTTIHWTRSQGQITQFLQGEKIQAIRFTNLPDSIMLEFMAFAKEVNREIPIRMRFPLPTDNEKEVNRIYRVFYWYLTNKFEAIRSGLVEEITREFLPFIAFKTKNGVDTTLYEALKEEGSAILGDSDLPLLKGV